MNGARPSAWCVPFAFASAAIHEVPVDDPLTDLGNRERSKRTTHVCTGIADLESSHQEGVECRTGDDTELTVR